MPHVSLAQLWIPILLSAVCVFVASSLVHMVLKWHASDYKALANEDDVRAAIRKEAPAPGQYVLPHCSDHKDMGKPEMLAKYQEGPVAMLVVMPNGAPAMGAALGKWFAFTVLVAVTAAYLAGRTLGFGTHYLQVFRVVGAVSFVAYGFGSITMAIWMGKPWSSVAKDLADALIYGLLSAGIFGWLWPR
ncbi:MAG: hypothetical protein HXX12_12980 [Geothrix sp.]|uniref:hypothetical protein n=1 Tax=Geothrix sp. TaxID=1962974 RepID=UPI0017EDBE82|nr:hypothetical protein [Geothrix sp.]NWJ41870.1 hypothetical protein [Geothrix sp.]WIL20157.1 MAG: hypothetical protein QOZ81_002703 [Geothrix sp.]